MIFALWPLPKAPVAGNQKICAVARAIHVKNSHIKFGWISEKNWPQTPAVSPKVQPLGHDPSDQMKILSNMFYIFHLWEDTRSLVFKYLKLTL